MSGKPAGSAAFGRSLLAPGSNVLVTGGAGFIGSNFIRYVLRRTGFSGRIINLDKLTYAGNPLSLEDIAGEFDETRYVFIPADICDPGSLDDVFKRYGVGAVVHFAAESHVDRSIHGPKDFVETNVTGTFNLLEAARSAWAGRRDVRFHHVSTDEVYGSLGPTGLFTENTAYDPRSPYSASKAASDHFVRAYHHTYGLPVTLSNCSNNYGPYQFPEKLIPLIILNALEGKPLPVYGDGSNVRDWLYVDDHCEAIWDVLERGQNGGTYNIGGECEMKNIDIVNLVCGLLEEMRPSGENPALDGEYGELITFVEDRPGHDQRYAIDCGKIRQELGWSPTHDLNQGLRDTVGWYLDNHAWVEGVRSGEYRNWINKNYNSR